MLAELRSYPLICKFFLTLNELYTMLLYYVFFQEKESSGEIEHILENFGNAALQSFFQIPGNLR